jgi:hypothetical protein
MLAKYYYKKPEIMYYGGKSITDGRKCMQEVQKKSCELAFLQAKYIQNWI